MYYVKAVTRSSGGSARGTPQQAVTYLTDGHDERRDPDLSRDELEYVARMDPDAEGHREAIRAAMHDAIGAALAEVFSDKVISAVAAIHARNETGEIHFHAHVLVAKFARDKASGRMFSLDSSHQNLNLALC